MIPKIAQALPRYAAACVRVQTRENTLSVERLRSIGISEASLAKSIETVALQGVVCEFADEVVGYCFGATETGEIMVVALLPEFEGPGLGGKLLGLVVELLRRRGHRRLFLGCSSDSSTRAYGFYRHKGWRSSGVRDQLGDEILELVDL